MSFDINPMKNLSNIQASSKTTDGGAGNTGYFEREEKEENTFNFETKDYPDDSFVKIEDIEEVLEEKTDFIAMLKEFLLKILNAIKKMFSK